MTSTTLSIFRVSTITAIFGAALLLTGCSAAIPGAAESPESVEVASTPTSDQVVTAEVTCTALSAPSSFGFNAFNEFRKGNIDVDERNQLLVDASNAYREVSVEPDSQLETGIQAVIAYIDASVPALDGAIVDPSTDEYANLSSNVGVLCSSAGTELVINAASGG